MAQFTIDNKAGRHSDVDECLKILDNGGGGSRASAEQLRKNRVDLLLLLVLLPGLKIAKSTPRPQDLVRTYYEARIDADECTACGDCIERCPMDAIAEGDTVSEVIDGRCIGCGLFVSVCPVEAISPEPKPGMEALPKDFTETLNRIAVERGVA